MNCTCRKEKIQRFQFLHKIMCSISSWRDHIYQKTYRDGKTHQCYWYSGTPNLTNIGHAVNHVPFSLACSWYAFFNGSTACSNKLFWIWTYTFLFSSSIYERNSTIICLCMMVLNFPPLFKIKSTKYFIPFWEASNDIKWKSMGLGIPIPPSFTTMNNMSL